MKVKTLLIAAFSLASTAISQASFTIDFNDTGAIASDAASFVGAPFDSGNSISIDVIGYGLVTLSTNQSLEIGSLYANALTTNSIQLENNLDQVIVTFPTDVIVFNAADLGQDQGESLQVSGALPGSVHTLTAVLDNGTNGLGVQSITFSEVPEPSSAILGCIGMGMILLRRRK